MEGHCNKTDEAKIVSTIVLLLIGRKSQRLLLQNRLIKKGATIYSIMTFFITISKCDTQHNCAQHNDTICLCRVSFMLSVIMMNVVMLDVMLPLKMVPCNTLIDKKSWHIYTFLWHHDIQHNSTHHKATQRHSEL